MELTLQKYFGVKLMDQQLRISLSLRLGAKILEKLVWRSGKLVKENGHHGLSCARLPRQHNFIDLMKQALSSNKISSILEPNGLNGSDGITLAPR